MSGFFMIRREEFLDCVYDQSQQGYKIFLDIVASAPALGASWNCPSGFATEGRWRARAGLQILVEYGILLVEKLSNEPPSTAVRVIWCDRRASARERSI